jgi:hypothetical protein
MSKAGPFATSNFHAMAVDSNGAVDADANADIFKNETATGKWDLGMCLSLRASHMCASLSPYMQLYLFF